MRYYAVFSLDSGLEDKAEAVVMHIVNLSYRQKKNSRRMQCAVSITLRIVFFLGTERENKAVMMPIHTSQNDHLDAYCVLFYFFKLFGGALWNMPCFLLLSLLFFRQAEADAVLCLPIYFFYAYC